jgi:hypothetical protein
LPDAADRIRVEPRVRVESKTRLDSKTQRPAKAGWVRAWAPKKKSTIAGAALAAMMIGIVVNALALQHGRRLALAPVPTAVAALKPSAPSLAPVVRPPAAVEEAPTPEPRPAPMKLALAREPKSDDAIADFLRAQAPDKRRLTLSAQEALAKLGFSVKATGALDSHTRSALLEFEKSHHIAASTEISARLVRALKAAAR